MNVKSVIKNAGKFVVKHAPKILTGIGIGGYFTAIGFAIKESPKAEKALNKLKEEKPDANMLDKAKVVIPIYWPMGVTALLSTGCIVWSDCMSIERYATLLAAYKLSEDHKAEIQDKMQKLLGPSKAQEVNDEVAKASKERFPYDEKLIYQTGKGNHRFLDSLTGTRFCSSVNDVQTAFLQTNNDLLERDTVCINDYLDNLGVPYWDQRYISGIDVGGHSAGDRFGWERSRRGLIKFDITWTNDDDGEPLGVISYDWDMIYPED